MKKQKHILAALCLASLIMLGGCATIVEGSDQSIYFSTNPAGAYCDITREGETLYSNVLTPTSLVLEKDKDHLVITCRKAGYHPATISSDSEFQGMTLGNLFLGGFIGAGVDFATGAARKYPSSIGITLRKIGETDESGEPAKPEVIICAEGHSCATN